MGALRRLVSAPPTGLATTELSPADPRLGGREPVASGSTSRAWEQALAITVWSRIVFFSIAFVANSVIASLHGQQKLGLFDVWLKWDAISFLLVAQHGYTSALTHPNSTAFFPLLPLLLRGLLALDVPGVVSGLLISGVASLIAFVYLYRLAEEELGAGAGTWALLFLAFFPSAVFIVAGYTEPIFLAGAIAAFYYARHRRWTLAALPLALATASRFAGVFLIAGLLAELVRQPQKSARLKLQALGALAVGCVPLLGYGLFLNRARGNPLYYFTDERLGWHRQFVSPINALLNTFSHPQSVLEVLSAAVGVFFIVWAARSREWGYAAYMGTALASLMTSTTYLSLPRILVSFFPIPLLLAAYVKERKLLGGALLTISGIVAAVGVVAFTHGLGFY
jgi:hypothetical protein